MVNQEVRSQLIDIVHHEHDHLRRLFDDIADSFEEIAAGEVEVEEKQEAIESASGELEVALEEMLHHFNQEEEVFFVDLEERFPELSDDIEQLVEAHEAMCEKTRWLKQNVSTEGEVVEERAGDVLEVLREMTDLLEQHTREENRIFGLALEKMPEDEQYELLDEMRKI